MNVKSLFVPFLFIMLGHYAFGSSVDCGCIIKSPVVLDDALSVVKFAMLIQENCSGSEAKVCIDNTLTFQTINVNDDIFDAIPNGVKVIALSGNLVVNRTRLRFLPEFLIDLQEIGNVLSSGPGDIDIRYNSTLESFILPKYSGEIQGKVSFSHNSLLATVEIPQSIKEVLSLKILSNQELKKLTSIYVSAANTIQVIGNPRITSLIFAPKRYTIKKEISIEGIDNELFRVLDLSGLMVGPKGTLERLSVTDNRYLRRLLGPSNGSNLVAIGDLIIKGNKEDLSVDSPRLDEFSGFSTLETIEGQLLLSSVRASSSELSKSIGKKLTSVGDLYLLDNNEVEDLDWLSSVEEIKGILYIKFNSRLCDCKVDIICSHEYLVSDSIAQNGKCCSSIESLKSACAGTSCLGVESCSKVKSGGDDSGGSDGGE